MKSIITEIVVSVIGIGFIFAHTPEIEWIKILPEGSACYHVQQTTDKGYVFSGRNLDGDFYLAKTDSLGNFRWQKNFPAERFCNLARSVQQTTDGGYIFLGSATGDTTFYIYVAKTDSLGNLQWGKKFAKDTTNHGYCIQQTNDGGYIFTGEELREDSSVFLVKIDSLGNTQWGRRLPVGCDIYSSFIPIQQTRDGGFIIGANNLIKTDSFGNFLWRKDVILMGWTFSVQQTTDGGYIATSVGTPFSNPRNFDVYLVKTDSMGDVQWEKTYGGSKNDHGNWVRQVNDGGYIVAGMTCSFGTNGDGYIIRTNSLGLPIWTKTLDTIHGEIFCIQQTEDGGYILIARANRLIKLAPEVHGR